MKSFACAMRLHPFTFKSTSRATCENNSSNIIYQENVTFLLPKISRLRKVPARVDELSDAEPIYYCCRLVFDLQSRNCSCCLRHRVQKSSVVHPSSTQLLLGMFPDGESYRSMKLAIHFHILNSWIIAFVPSTHLLAIMVQHNSVSTFLVHCSKKCFLVFGGGQRAKCAASVQCT
jgi:hypothetical protein